MEDQTLVQIDLIDHNPYQPRQVEDAAAVAEIAESIRRNGLMQVPTARRVGERVQLAFGHTRLAAFKLNGEPCMPLIIRNLTDLQMFELGVGENIKRRDLNPIEQATSMRRYMDEFGKTSVEAGEFFNVSPEKVRGTLRYLNLPEPVQVKLAAGEINQDAARRLLTIARVDEGQIKQAVENITSGMSADEALNEAMNDSDNAFVMWFGWKHGKPLAGEGLWPIDLPAAKFPMKHLPKLTASDAAKALDIDEKKDLLSGQLRAWVEAFDEQPSTMGGGHWYQFNGSHRIEGDVAQFLIESGAPANQIEKISHLLNPPACSACPFHSVSDKQHICGFKPCHKRKRKAWMDSEVAKVSKKLGIAMYAPEQDGKAVLALNENSYQDEYKRHAELVKKQDPNLRIQAHYNEYSEHKWTESHLCRVILTGAGAKAQKERVQQAKAKEQAREHARHEEWALENKRRDASDRFQEKVANHVFAVAFKEMTNIHVMAALVGAVPPKKEEKKADVLNGLRIRLADEALDHMIGWDKKKQGPVVVAKHLQGVATTWGVKLPADFLDVAKGFEPVTTETPKKKKEA